MPEAFGMVKVGNSACGLAKLTPRSRSAAMAGAVSGFTCSARSPSGTNRMRLRGFGPSSEQAARSRRTLAVRATLRLRWAGIGSSLERILIGCDEFYAPWATNVLRFKSVDHLTFLALRRNRWLGVECGACSAKS